MNLEHGKLSELEKYLAIYKRAREFMISTGNKNQWKEGYPPKEMIINDINSGIFYVLKDKEDIVAIFALIKGIDKTYIHIYEGNWINDSIYYTIHRFASSFNKKHAFHEAIKLLTTDIKHIRIDTHADNKIMQKAIKNENFKYAGIIYLENGDPRMAYELVI